MSYGDDPSVLKEACQAAALGCALCEGPIRLPPAGPPFSGGPNQGRYFCDDCWTLYYADHPEHLADRATVDWVRKKSDEIRLRRAKAKGEILFDDGDTKAILTDRGTIVLEVTSHAGLASHEYDPDRFLRLARAIQGVHEARLENFQAPSFT